MKCPHNEFLLLCCLNFEFLPEEKVGTQTLGAGKTGRNLKQAKPICEQSTLLSNEPL